MSRNWIWPGSFYVMVGAGIPPPPTDLCPWRDRLVWLSDGRWVLIRKNWWCFFMERGAVFFMGGFIVGAGAGGIEVLGSSTTTITINTGGTVLVGGGTLAVTSGTIVITLPTGKAVIIILGTATGLTTATMTANGPGGGGPVDPNGPKGTPENVHQLIEILKEDIRGYVKRFFQAETEAERARIGDMIKSTAEQILRLQGGK